MIKIQLISAPGSEENRCSQQLGRDCDGGDLRKGGGAIGMAADQRDQPYCMGKKGGSEEFAYCPTYRDGPLAEWRGLRILDVALSALRRAGPVGNDDPDRTYNVSSFLFVIASKH
jgi:hypothetical protein